MTSGGTGFRIGRCLALGYVNAEVGDEVTEFEIEILGEARAASLSRRAFYDPDNRRLRG